MWKWGKCVKRIYLDSQRVSKNILEVTKSSKSEGIWKRGITYEIIYLDSQKVIDELTYWKLVKFLKSEKIWKWGISVKILDLDSQKVKDNILEVSKISKKWGNMKVRD